MKITRLVIPAILAFTTPAAAYDCGEFTRQVIALPDAMQADVGRLRVTLINFITLDRLGTVEQKWAAIAAARPLTDELVTTSRKRLATLNEGQANGCVPAETNSQFLALKASMLEIIAAGENARAAVDTELRKIGK